MMRAAALLCLTLMSVLILSWGLPQLYDMALLKSLDKTHAFFSPVLKKFMRVLHKECYNGILQLRSSLCNTVQNVRQSGL